MTHDGDRQHRSRRRRARLTRRGRLIVTMVLAAGAVLGAVGTVAQASGPARGIRVGYVVVEEGDSLWSIASEMTQGDPRPVMEAIRDLNGLDGQALWPGYRVLVPLDAKN